MNEILKIAGIPYTRDFIGNSDDEKPTVGIPVGSSFYETDTGDTYIYDGEQWHNLTVEEAE